MKKGTSEPPLSTLDVIGREPYLLDYVDLHLLYGLPVDDLKIIILVEYYRWDTFLCSNHWKVLISLGQLHDGNHIHFYPLFIYVLSHF